MPPSTSRYFQRAATQRLATAEFLLKSDYNLDAMYLAEYAIECSLKALILERTPVSLREERREALSGASKMHYAEVLAEILLRECGIRTPHLLMLRVRKAKWSTALRYQTRRMDTGKVSEFLETAREVYSWVENQLS